MGFFPAQKVQLNLRESQPHWGTLGMKTPGKIINKTKQLSQSLFFFCVKKKHSNHLTTKPVMTLIWRQNFRSLRGLPSSLALFVGDFFRSWKKWRPLAVDVNPGFLWEKTTTLMLRSLEFHPRWMAGVKTCWILHVDFLETSYFGGRMIAYLDPSRVANSSQTSWK